jgi:hypothetical protein
MFIGAKEIEELSTGFTFLADDLFNPVFYFLSLSQCEINVFFALKYDNRRWHK